MGLSTTRAPALGHCSPAKMPTLCGGQSRDDENNVNPLRTQHQYRRRWLVLLAAHLSFLLWEGLCKSLGVMLQSITEQLDSETWPVGFTIGMMIAARGLAGLFLRALEERCQYQQITFVSGLLVGVGVIGASRTTTVLQFGVCLVLFSGLGYGMTLNTSLVLLSRNFQQLYACANGVAYSGGSIGILLFAPLSQLLLDTYGWQGALLLVGGIQLHLAVLGSLMRSPPHRDDQTGYTKIDADEVPFKEEKMMTTGEPKQGHSDGRYTCSQLCHKFVKDADLDLFCQLSYLTLIACLSNLCFINIAWMVYTVPHLLVKGLTTYSATVVCWAGAIGILVGQLGNGLLVDFNLFKGRTVMYMANLLMALPLLCDPFLFGKWPLAASYFLFGVGLGIALPLTFTMMRDAVGVSRMTNAVGWAELVGGAFRISASFLTGWFYDQLGSYDLAFVLLGCSPCVTVIILIIEDVYLFIQKICRRNVPI